MAREKLGELRKRIRDRYQEIVEQVKNYQAHDLIANSLEKKIFRILSEYGIDYPRTFDIPPPDVYVPARQGTKFLDPFGSTTGSSPPIPSDETCLTWKARDGGFLVIDHLDFIMEDPIAEDFFTIRYFFDGQENTANFQSDQGINEPGHWKFNRIVLIDGESLRICIKNTNPYAGGYFSWENRLWSL
jgi:hypothetical protein